jgi:singapore isolate B (sub-type 7) whole genome shotgun sequence assembly, scaffold_7
MNEFNRCQTQLRELYGQGIPSDCVIEFTCYQLLYCIFAQQHIDTNTFLKVLTKEQLANRDIRLVLKICSAIRLEDYLTFFALYEQEEIPYECKHFMKQFFKRLRITALFSLFNT